MISGYKTVLINYADQGFARAQHLNTWAGKHLGKFDQVIEYCPEKIDKEFYTANRDVLSIKRGAGEWLWKPYIILKTLKDMNEGDFLFYCDSGAFMIRSCQYLFESMKDSDLWVSNIPLIEKQWTKPAVISEMGASGREDILNSNQIQGGFVAVRKSPFTVDFIAEWLSKCCNARLLLPLSENEEKGECISHREDQSILSILCKLYGIRPHRDPTQYGRIPEKYRCNNALFSIPDQTEDTYPVLILLHRTGSCELKVICKQWLNTVLPKKIVYRLIR